MYYLLVLCVLSVASTYAQKQILYYSGKWEITPKELATYFRVCDYNPTYLFFKGELKDYTLDSTLVMSGSYSTYGIKDGEFYFYFPSGKLQAHGNFKKGLRDGSWKYYYENGSLEREVVFSDSTFSPVTVYDPTGKKIINNGNGPWSFEYERYNEKETCIIKGQFKNGKKHGTWKCLLSSGDVVYREIYKEGKFKSGIVFFPFRSAFREPFENQFALPYKFQVTEKFRATPETKKHHYPDLTFLPQDSDSVNRNGSDDEKVFYAVEQQAEFLGGRKAYMKFVEENLVYPKDAQRMGLKNVFVKFIVKKDGSISSIEVMKGINESLDREAIRLVSIMPKWSPGKQNGVAVNSQFVLPISFKLH
jgi:TonB family protein